MLPKVRAPSGQVGGALQFDGQGDYVVTPALDGLETNTVTFSMWVRPEETEVPYGGLIYNRTIATGLHLETMSGSRFKVGYTWNFKDWQWDSGLTLRPKRWSHVALVVEPNQATLYVNGERSTHDVSQDPHAKFRWTGETHVGGDSSAGRYFSGGMDEIAIWNRALSSHEIDGIYENGRSRRKVLHYTMDESDISGATLKNTSGDTSFNATLNGSPESVSGILGQALTFDGEGKYGLIPPMHLNSNHLTITGWMKRHGTQTNYAGIVYSHVPDTVGGINFKANSELSYTWGNHYGWSTGLTPPDEEWSFFALVVQPHEAAMYLNGDKKTHLHEHEILGFAGQTNIARDYAGRNINGDLDEIQLWNRALGEDEIDAIYQNLAPSETTENSKN